MAFLCAGGRQGVMGRRGLIVRAARQFQRLPLSWARPLETAVVRSRATGGVNLVVLLALPRSGSTLTYQALVHALQPLYLSNLSNLLYTLPWTGGRLAGRRCAGYESDFRSSQGFVDGICGPAEGLRFWSYWNGCGLDETAGPPVSERRLEERVAYLGEVVSALTSPATPFVTGYLGHALIIERLRAWFPEAVFVRLHRDALSNAASILRSRQRAGGGWFSVFPRECEALREADELPQVAGQVYWLNRRLDVLAGDGRTVHLAYEDLCRDPEAEIRRVVDFCNGAGMGLEVRKPLPASFDCNVVHEGENGDVDALAAWLREMEAQYGAMRPSRYAGGIDELFSGDGTSIAGDRAT